MNAAAMLYQHAALAAAAEILSISISVLWLLLLLFSSSHVEDTSCVVIVEDVEQQQ